MTLTGSANIEFVDRETELGELRNFVFNSEHTVFLLIGKMGMGKSALLKEFNRQLQDDRSVVIPEISILYRAQSPEEFAADLSQTLTDNRFLLWSPDDKQTFKRAIAILPVIGPLVQALIKDESKSERKKLEEILTVLGRNIKDRIVIMIDPYDDYVEKSEYQDFFTMLAHRLAATIKIIIAQRPADVLAASKRFLNLPAVTTNKTELQPLQKDDAYRMASSLISDGEGREKALSAILEHADGWPLRISFQAGMYGRGEALDGSGDLDRDFAVLLDRCDTPMRHLLFAIALAPSGIYLEDLPKVSGLSAEELDQAINSRASRDVIQSFEQFGAIRVQVFHASLRDYLLENMARIGVVDDYLSRLHGQLLKNAIELYSKMDEESVTKRDAGALHYSRKLRLYEPLLRSNPKTREIANLLLERIDSLRFGGRSFSLYSLLVLARAHALSIRAEDGERFLKVLHKVIGEDSFLHVEYAVLLLGIVLSMSDLNLHPESIQTCRRRISLVAKLPKQHVKSRVAEVVDKALTERIDPLKQFELEEMLPKTFSEATVAETEDWNSSDLELRIARLIQTPVSEWKKEERQLMDLYIRFTEGES